MRLALSGGWGSAVGFKTRVLSWKSCGFPVLSAPRRQRENAKVRRGGVPFGEEVVSHALG